MRGAFARTLAELAESDPRILLLTGDLGFMALEPFADKFPGRFFNAGVAEQNMVGLATGLAEAGFVPFVYSIVTFAVLRPYEFIRNGPVMHQLPVRIVGVGGGLEYGSNGTSHQGLEDLALTRVQPGLTVVAPADGAQARSALQATWDLPGPVYYRLGKDDKLVLPELHGRFKLGRAEVLGDGNDLLFVAMGAIATETAAAVRALRAQGIACTLAVVSSFNPAPADDLAEVLANHRLALTVEAHYTTGGLGSFVAEVIAERGLGCRLVRCGVKAALAGVSGSQAYLHRAHGISRDGLVATAVQALSAGHEGRARAA